MLFPQEGLHENTYVLRLMQECEYDMSEEYLFSVFKQGQIAMVPLFAFGIVKRNSINSVQMAILSKYIDEQAH